MTRWAPSRCDLAGCAAMIDDGEGTRGASVRIDARICQKDAKALANGDAVLMVALAPAAWVRAPGCHCIRTLGGELDPKGCPIHGAEPSA